MHYTKQEFGFLTGEKTNNLSNYIKRKQVVVGADGLIDSDNEKNALFIEKRCSDIADDTEFDVAKPKNPDFPEFDDGWTGATDTRGFPVMAKAKNKSAKSNLPTLTESERSFKYHQSEKYRLESELKILELQKKLGSLIPTELMGAVIAQQSKSFSSAYRQSLSRVMDLLALKYKLTGADVADMRKIVVDTVNKAIEDALAESKREVKAIAKEFSEKRKMDVEN